MEPGSVGEVKHAAPESLLARRRLPRFARPAQEQGDGMLWLIGATVVVVGALLAIQPLLNARIAHVAGHSIYGAMFSVLVSSLTMLAAALLLRLPLPDLHAIKSQH